jgi:ribose 1,5-bisphosphokinase PhnN
MFKKENNYLHNLILLNKSRIKSFKTLSPEIERKVFIIGASGSGKSTLLQILYSYKNSQITFPTRLVSRHLRPDDDLNENEHLGYKYFNEYFINNQLEFFWPKFLPESTELYGFKFCKAPLCIYGCNNEFIINAKFIQSHSNLNSNSLFILISCKPNIIAQRLMVRYKTTAVSKKELEYRLATSSKEFIVKKSCDLIVKNDSDDIEKTAKNLIEFVFN